MVDMGNSRDAPTRAGRGIEHPGRNLQSPSGCLARQAATENRRTMLLKHIMDINSATGPRMPRIENLPILGPVGVPSSRCTTRCGPTRSTTASLSRPCVSDPRAIGCATPTSSADRPLPSRRRRRYVQPGLSLSTRDQRGAGQFRSYLPKPLCTAQRRPRSANRLGTARSNTSIKSNELGNREGIHSFPAGDQTNERRIYGVLREFKGPQNRTAADLTTLPQSIGYYSQMHCDLLRTQA